MNPIVEDALLFLKKKNTMIGIISLMIAVVLLNFFTWMYRDNIRAAQIESVVSVSFENEQFQSVQEAKLRKLLTSKELTVIGVIEGANNKGLGKLEEVFNQKQQVVGLPDKVYIYQPIYEDKKLMKELNVTEANTFMVIEGGKEIGRYSFNDLSSGFNEVVEEIETITNPKVPRKSPVRVEKKTGESTETTTSDSTKPSEVSFE